MCTIAGEERAVDGKVCCLPRVLQYQYERGKISCRRLEWEGGAVSSRVALLLRSAEAQPYLPRFVWIFQTFFLGGVNVRSALCTSMGLFPKGSQPLPRATRLDFWTFSIFRLFPKGSAFASRTTFGKSQVGSQPWAGLHSSIVLFLSFHFC